jgi:DNA-binding NarL/FixJ family response regulator
VNMTDPEEPAAREVKVAIVDDDPMVRAALRMMLDGAEGLRVVGEAADGAEVPDMVASHFPDVVLMDLRMPRVNGVTATQRLQRSPTAPAVVVLTTFDADDDIVSALRAGAKGFLLKDTPPREVVEALHRVAAGDPILSPSVLDRLVSTTVTSADVQHRAREVLDVLTGREVSVAVRVARGMSNSDIAAELFVSQATVKAHISSMLAKLMLDNRTQLALLTHDARLD